MAIQGTDVLSRTFPVKTGEVIVRETFVKVTADGLETATAGEDALGVALFGYDNTTSTVPSHIWPDRVGVSTRILGTAFVELGGTVATGEDVEVGTGGKAIKLNAGKKVGLCLQGGVSGDIVEILLIKTN